MNPSGFEAFIRPLGGLLGGGSQGFAVRLVALLVARVCGFSGSCPAGGLSASVLCEVFASAACLSWAFRLATSRRWAFSRVLPPLPEVLRSLPEGRRSALQAFGSFLRVVLSMRLVVLRSLVPFQFSVSV